MNESENIMNKLKLNNEEVINATIENIDMADYPDCVMAYFDNAVFKNTLLPLDDIQMIALQEENADTFYEMLREEVFNMGDY